jgi:hypothetical protein
MAPNGINLSPDIPAVGSTLNSARHLIANPGTLRQQDIINKLAGMISMVNLWSDSVDVVARNKMASDIVFGFRHDIVRGWIEARKIHYASLPPAFNDFRSFSKRVMDARDAKTVATPSPVAKKIPKAPVGFFVSSLSNHSSFSLS